MWIVSWITQMELECNNKGPYKKEPSRSKKVVRDNGSNSLD